MALILCFLVIFLPSFFLSLDYKGQGSVLLLLTGARSRFKSCRQEQDVSTPAQETSVATLQLCREQHLPNDLVLWL